MDLREDSRFRGMKPFERKIWLSSPTMHGEELLYMKEAYETNWMSTVGENLDAIEAGMTKRLGIACGVALSSGTAALHLAVKAAAERIYFHPRWNGKRRSLVWEKGILLGFDLWRYGKPYCL